MSPSSREPWLGRFILVCLYLVGVLFILACVWAFYGALIWNGLIIPLFELMKERA